MLDVGIELGAACMPSEHASDQATAPGGGMNYFSYIITVHEQFQYGLGGMNYFSYTHLLF